MLSRLEQAAPSLDCGSEFNINLCIGTKPTYLNSVGHSPADGEYNRHPGRGTTADHRQLQAAQSPAESI